MTDKGDMVEQLSVHTKENAFDWRLFANVQSGRFLQDVSLELCVPLLLQKMLGPRRHHHLDAVKIGSAQILVEAPAISSISKVNEANFTKQLDELRAARTINFEFVSDRDRSVVWPRDMQQLVGHAGDRRRSEIEFADKIDRERDRQQKA